MWLSRQRNRVAPGVFSCGAWLALAAVTAQGQTGPPVRRAQPVNEPPVARAVPFDQPTPRARPAPSTGENPPPAPEGSPQSGDETQPNDERQLEYASALFGRKLYDLAIPELEKYLDQYPNAPGRAQAQFFLGESYRALNKPGAARRNFQAVLDEHGDSEYAEAAAYVLAETALTQNDYGAALPLFHLADAKSKTSVVVMSAR